MSLARANRDLLGSRQLFSHSTQDFEAGVLPVGFWTVDLRICMKSEDPHNRDQRAATATESPTAF
jgi:hypothetical protein